MKTLSRSLPLAAPLLAALTVACGGDDAGYYDEGTFDSGGQGVGQGGARAFVGPALDPRRLADPSPETLDDVGFFGEHKIPLPAPECGQSVCLHGLFGQMGNMINGSNCTTLLLGMNTPIDPAELERPPLNLALAIDVSGSMQGDSIYYVREGLTRMLDALEPGDKISLVTFSASAAAITEFVPGDDSSLAQAIDALEAGGGTNLFDGLRTAMELIEGSMESTQQNRVILLSDGVATEGITSDAKILEMATAASKAQADRMLSASAPTSTPSSCAPSPRAAAGPSTSSRILRPSRRSSSRRSPPSWSPSPRRSPSPLTSPTTTSSAASTAPSNSPPRATTASSRSPTSSSPTA
ncbi:MAG: VWA domain-containing protein [Nannocystaceae bacterium]